MEQAIADKLGVLDAMKDSILCIHGGGVYNNKPVTIRRWIMNFNKLAPEIRRRIALENCEKCYCAEDVLAICRELSIPMIFDFHHYNCYSVIHPEFKQKPISELLPQIVDTWKVRNMKPKFHLSDQAVGKMTGAHHDYVQSIPQELLDLANTGYAFDIMIEAKCKDLAVFQILLKYPQLKGDVIIPQNFTPIDITKSSSTTDDDDTDCADCADCTDCRPMHPTGALNVLNTSSASTTEIITTTVSITRIDTVLKPVAKIKIRMLR